jgi:hypothetical protein
MSFMKGIEKTCIVCLLILGAALLSILLIGQDCPAQTGICDSDPCQSIPNAGAGTCTEFGGSCSAASDFFCSCDGGHTWQGETHTCEEDAVDPCEPDPCGAIVNAVPASCAAVGDDDYTCSCDLGYTWQAATHTCESSQPNCDGVVNFPDPNLEQAIRDAIGKPTGDIYGADLLGRTHLYAYERLISDLSGLECCTALTWLYLPDNQIVDVSPLSGLTSLTELGLWSNQIVDVSPLAGLINLTALDLGDNQIVDVSPLSGLTSLTEFGLWSNQIVDVSPLAGLINLTQLVLDYNEIVDMCPLVDNAGLDSGDLLYLPDNPLSTTSCTVCIPQLEGRSVDVTHDCP